MKMKGMLLASLTLLSGAVMLTACSANQRKASDSKTLYLMQTGDILSLDNSNQANLTQWNVLEQSMEGMYRAGKNGKLIPAMATSIVKPTNSGRTYTYHLRKNARWSNGDPVTAQDFVTSWRRSTAPTSKSGYNYIFTGIKNAEQISAGKMPPSSLGVRALDRHTLRVDLEYAMPYFNKMMVMPAFFPQNTGYVKKFGDKYGTNSARVACNGAFKVQGWTGTNDKWSLTPNTHYYDRKNIRMDKMVMQIGQDGHADCQGLKHGAPALPGKQTGRCADYRNNRTGAAEKQESDAPNPRRCLLSQDESCRKQGVQQQKPQARRLSGSRP